MSGRIVALRSGSVLVERKGDCGELPTSLPSGIEVEEEKFSFDIKGEHYEVMTLSAEAVLPSDGSLFETGLRESWSLLPDGHYAAASKGSELAHWGRMSRYCGRCGVKMHRSSEISKKCPHCGLEVFAPVSPAVIVLVKRGDEALLVHAKNFRRPFFGLVAGFVETGESLEECVEREVREETTLRISNVRYFGSQSWPFPAQLMVGFTAEYAGGELAFADGELSEGGFFTRDNLPALPTYPSIARRMIDAWVAEGK